MYRHKRMREQENEHDPQIKMEEGILVVRPAVASGYSDGFVFFVISNL